MKLIPFPKTSMLAALVALSMAVVACGSLAEPTAAPTSAAPTAASTGATANPPLLTAVAGRDATAAPTATAQGSGTLQLRVTDAPNAEITAIWLTASKIEVSTANGGWSTVAEEPSTFELLALEGVEAVLGEADLPAGRYTQVRLSVPAVDVERGAEMVSAEVPSDKIKLVGTFVLEPGVTTWITLDFDAEKSLVERGPNGFLFKPVIKMSVGDPGEQGRPAVSLTTRPDQATGSASAETPTPTPLETVEPTATATATPIPTPTPSALGTFFLDIESPEELDAVVDSNEFLVIGRTTVDAAVSVNDTFADVDEDGRFKVVVALLEGPNVVEVVASDTEGNEFSEVLLIVYEPA